MKRRVVLVDDHHMFRAGVKAELGDAVEVVGEAASVAEAVPLIRELDPDVVLLDVHLPDGGGDVVISAVAPDRPGVRFLALSVSDAAEDVIAVIRAGARGYVTKTISGEELAQAIERVAEGDAVFSPRLAGFALDAFRGGERVGGDAELDELTPREREVLAADRPRLHVQGDRGPAQPLREDGGEPRLERPAQAAALEPARADALGDTAPARLTRRLEPYAERLTDPTSLRLIRLMGRDAAGLAHAQRGEAVAASLSRGSASPRARLSVILHHPGGSSASAAAPNPARSSSACTLSRALWIRHLTVATVISSESAISA